MNILALLYFMLPSYIANMTPVITKGILKKLAYPLDFGIRLKGKPLLGKNKTWRGLVLGVAAGTLMFLLQKWLYQFEFFQQNSIINYSSAAIWIGVLLAFGTLVGDMAESFLKRRAGVKPGNPWIPFDQIDYTIGALALASIVFFRGWAEAFTIVLISAFLHIAVNDFAYYTHIRKEKS